MEKSNKGYKLNSLPVNGVWFRGQYATALRKMRNGEKVTIHDFKNGAWESTSKLNRFIDLLIESGTNFNVKGSSLRKLEITS